jgi:hypothetical protein
VNKKDAFVNLDKKPCKSYDFKAMPVWWNGRHRGLKIPRLLAVLVRVRSPAPPRDSTNDRRNSVRG